MNNRLNRFQRWRRRLGARLARPQAVFLGSGGVLQAGGQVLPFAGWCESHAGAAAEIIVSARLLHELVCEPGLPLEGEAALQAYARQLFSHYFGAAAQRWPLASWQAGAQRGATALHGLDWAALQQQARDADVDLRRARPAWAPLLSRLLQEEAAALSSTVALAWVEGDLLTWVLLQGAQVQSLRQMRLAQATPSALAETLAELRAADRTDAVVLVGYGLVGAGVAPAWPGVRVLGRLDGAGPDLAAFELPDDRSARLPQPDFLGRRIPRSLLAWPLAVTGVLVLASAAWSALGSHQQREQAQLNVMAELTAGPQPALARKPVSKLADAERLRAAAEVQALLQQAWEPLLAQVEQAGASLPAGQLSWLALDYGAGHQALRLEGLVQDKAVALQLVDRLAAAPGWQAVVLSRFQNAEQGLAGQRFELGARLQSDRLTQGKTP